MRSHVHELRLELVRRARDRDRPGAQVRRARARSRRPARPALGPATNSSRASRPPTNIPEMGERLRRLPPFVEPVASRRPDRRPTGHRAWSTRPRAWRESRLRFRARRFARTAARPVSRSRPAPASSSRSARPASASTTRSRHCTSAASTSTACSKRSRAPPLPGVREQALVSFRTASLPTMLRLARDQFVSPQVRLRERARRGAPDDRALVFGDLVTQSPGTTPGSTRAISGSSTCSSRPGSNSAARAPGAPPTPQVVQPPVRGGDPARPRQPRPKDRERAIALAGRGRTPPLPDRPGGFANRLFESMIEDAIAAALEDPSEEKLRLPLKGSCGSPGASTSISRSSGPRSACTAASPPIGLPGGRDPGARARDRLLAGGARTLRARARARAPGVGRRRGRRAGASVRPVALFLRREAHARRR